MLLKASQAYLDRLSADPSGSINRIATISYGVQSEKLVHDFDVSRLLKQVMRLFEWYSDEETRRTYMAPYFALIQSSGTGKTKLLWEMRALVNDEKEKAYREYECRTILCADAPQSEQIDPIFSHYLQVINAATELTRSSICAQLDDVLRLCREKKVILLFDEAQHLLGQDGFAFRCVRWWLRIVRSDVQVVAVFTGTTLRLTNFYDETRVPTSTREPKKDHYNSGSLLFDPFYNLYTTGIVANEELISVGTSEYENAIPYGRPLFAVLHKNGMFPENKLSGILERMLLSKPSRWEKDLRACCSIIGTRVQVGQTSVALTAELVANGYAWLAHYKVSNDNSPGQARLCYKTDPVCARLAMCMMDDEWSMNSARQTVVGRSKRFWIDKICEIFSTGLCPPNQGELGEIAGASYLLFCGDLLRKRIDVDYKTFSVPLEPYVGYLVHAGVMNDVSKNITPNTGLDQYKFTEAHVSFIQVVRNYLRFPIADLERLDILKDMYKAGIAYYTYPRCPVFDIVASIRLTKPDMTFRYVPLLVSISTEKGCTDNSAVLLNMKKTMIKSRTFGVGIRLVFDEPHDNSTELLSTHDVNTLLQGEIVSKVVVVPGNDQFGIVKLLEAVTDGPAESEVDISDFFIRTPKLQARFNQSALLRTSANLAQKTYLKQAIEKNTKATASKRKQAPAGSATISESKKSSQRRTRTKTKNKGLVPTDEAKSKVFDLSTNATNQAVE